MRATGKPWADIRSLVSLIDVHGALVREQDRFRRSGITTLLFVATGIVTIHIFDRLNRRFLYYLLLSKDAVSGN